MQRLIRYYMYILEDSIVAQTMRILKLVSVIWYLFKYKIIKCDGIMPVTEFFLLLTLSPPPTPHPPPPPPKKKENCLIHSLLKMFKTKRHTVLSCVLLYLWVKIPKWEEISRTNFPNLIRGRFVWSALSERHSPLFYRYKSQVSESQLWSEPWS